METCFGFFSHFIFDDRPISLEAPNHFSKNSPVVRISENNDLGSFIQEWAFRPPAYSFTQNHRAQESLEME